MAKSRQVKKGLDFFPLDVNFFNDIKVKKLIKNQGSKSISIYIYLLCLIYENGYYIKWDKDLPFFISDITGCKESYVLDVINYCINIDLFSKELHELKSILTSVSIQERYTTICFNAKRKSRVDEYSLIENSLNSEDKTLNSEDKTLNSEFKTKIPNVSEFKQQSKVKESKVNNNTNVLLEKKPTKKNRVGVFENSNFGETPNTTSLKNSEEEKEKSSVKKEKELPEGFATELRNSQFFKNVCEFFSQKSESLQLKVAGRIISIARENKFQEFMKQTTAYMNYKNQTGERVHRFQNFSFEWDQDDWIDKFKKLNQTQNGSKEANNPNDPKIGRENLSAYEKLYKQMAGE